MKPPSQRGSFAPSTVSPLATPAVQPLAAAKISSNNPNNNNNNDTNNNNINIPNVRTSDAEADAANKSNEQTNFNIQPLSTPRDDPDENTIISSGFCRCSTLVTVILLVRLILWSTKILT